MRDQGATPEEIHAAVTEMLQSYGIELPEDWGQRLRAHRFGSRKGIGIFQQLNKEQREVLRDKVEEMQEANASREEIRKEVLNTLKDWGIDVPENWRPRFGFRRFGQQFGDGLFRQLDQEQRKAIFDKIKELHEQNASREEINNAVKELLEGYGVDVPDDWKGLRPPHHQVRRAIMRQLTEEQRETLKAKIQKLRDQGATRREIRQAVWDQLKEWGIEPPKPRSGRHGRRQNRPKMGDARQGNNQTLEARNYPNPFNPETNIVYTLKNAENVSLKIYNTNGQLVQTLVNSEQSAGTHTVRWNGRDENGMMLPSGLYYYHIDAGGNAITKGMILLK